MNILIQTTQNVVLTYPLANVGVRIAAFVLDLVIVLFFYFGLIITVLGRSEIAQILLSALLFLTYHLLFEVFMNGQSPGKKIVNIQVVSLDGRSPSLDQLLIRWSFRLLDIGVSFGLAGLFFAVSSSLQQKLGDVLAGTIVVNKKSLQHPGLHTLVKLNQAEKGHINPLLKKYSDEDMIIVKTLLARVRSYDTIENKSLLRKMANKIKEDLKETDQTTDAETYLNKILHDYIIITR